MFERLGEIVENNERFPTEQDEPEASHFRIPLHYYGNTQISI